MVWSNDYEPHVKGQRYASDGSEVGDEFQVDSDSAADSFNPTVAMAASGDFVVLWEEASRLKGQLYASDGSRVGDELLVTVTNLGASAVAMAADGDFAVSWQDKSFDEDNIQGRLYAADGSPLGGEFLVNNYTTGSQGSPAIAAAAPGNFVVTWDSDSSGGTDTDGRSVQKTLFGLIFEDGFESGDTTAWSATSPTR